LSTTVTLHYNALHMKHRRNQKSPSSRLFLGSLPAWVLTSFIFPTSGQMVSAAVSAQVEDSSDLHVAAEGAKPPANDLILAGITAKLQGVTSANVAALAKALRISEAKDKALPGTLLSPIGDLDGDGVEEMILKWAIPDDPAEASPARSADSQPLWGVYLLSWDGSRWKASPLVTAVENFVVTVINLGPTQGRCLAVTIVESDPQAEYPVVLQVRDHAATPLWDAENAESRYQLLVEGHVRFEDHNDAPARMVVTGRANPGLLQFDSQGHRGFQAVTFYHWDGKAFVPAKPAYSASEDYTIYRFISALHLHDYRSAYALVDPRRFLHADAPTVEVFRSFIQDNWPEFLQDEIFQAPEPPTGAKDEHLFVLPRQGSLNVYHPIFSSDGKFLLTALTRTQEALPEAP
jgi:hypothetical protein